MRQVTQSIRQNENSFTPSYGSINQVEWTDNFRLCQSRKIWGCFCIHSCIRFIFLVCVEVHKPLVMLLDSPVNLYSQLIKFCFCLWKYAAGAFCSPLCNPKSFCALSSLQDSLCGGLSGSLHNVEQDWCVSSCNKHRFWSWTSTTVFLLFRCNGVINVQSYVAGFRKLFLGVPVLWQNTIRYEGSSIRQLSVIQDQCQCEEISSLSLILINSCQLFRISHNLLVSEKNPVLQTKMFHSYTRLTLWVN